MPSMITKSTEFLSVTELSKILGVTRQAVIDRIRRGTLEAQKVGKVFVIPKHEADRALSEKR